MGSLGMLGCPDGCGSIKANWMSSAGFLLWVRTQCTSKKADLGQCVLLQGQGVKDVARSKHTQALADVKRLERQKGELLTVLKKQARLIDVLRRQRAHLEAAQLLSFSEEEFMQTLDVRAG